MERLLLSPTTQMIVPSAMCVLSKQSGTNSRVSNLHRVQVAALVHTHDIPEDKKTLLHDDALGKPKGTPQDLAWCRHPADRRASKTAGADVRARLCAMGCARGS